MAIHPSILAWEILWTKEAGRLQSMVVAEQNMIKHTSIHTHTHTHVYSSLMLQADIHTRLVASFAVLGREFGTTSSGDEKLDDSAALIYRQNCGASWIICMLKQITSFEFPSTGTSKSPTFLVRQTHKATHQHLSYVFHHPALSSHICISFPPNSCLDSYSSSDYSSLFLSLSSLYTP